MHFDARWVSMAGLSDSAKAADFLGIPSIPGPFEMNPKDAVVIGARQTRRIFVGMGWDGMIGDVCSRRWISGKHVVDV